MNDACRAIRQRSDLTPMCVAIIAGVAGQGTVRIRSADETVREDEAIGFRVAAVLVAACVARRVFTDRLADRRVVELNA